MVAQHIAFGVTAFAMAVGAVRVVTTKNVVHAALWLMLVLAGVAANFILLASEFVAVVQVLVYIGAIVVLFLFGIMLTRAPIGRESNLDNSMRPLTSSSGCSCSGSSRPSWASSTGGCISTPPGCSAPPTWPSRSSPSTWCRSRRSPSSSSPPSSARS